MAKIKTHFTPTECRLMALLETGRLCRRKELEACLEDELAGSTALLVHICNIRKKLPPGLLIIYTMPSPSVRGWMIVRELKVEN